MRRRYCWWRSSYGDSGVHLERNAPRAHTVLVAPCRGSLQHLAGDEPIIAASDHVRVWPQLIAAYLRAPITALLTDGFGRSDTRVALRSFFEVDRNHIVLAALTALRERGDLDDDACAEAIRRYAILIYEQSPWQS